MGFRIGTRVGNTYVSTNGHNVRTTTKVGKNIYVTNTFGKKQKINKKLSTKCSTNGLAFSYIGIFTFVGFLLWTPFNYIFNIDLESGTLPSFNLLPVLLSFVFMIFSFLLDMMLISGQCSSNNYNKVKNNKKEEYDKKEELDKKEREKEILLKNRLKHAEYNKKQSLKFEREYQSIIKMYPSFKNENHKATVNTVKKYRQYEYNNVLKAHQKEREELYNKLFETNMNRYNNIDKAIEETVKYLDENFDWIND